VKLETTYLNERVELLGGSYRESAAAELKGLSALYGNTLGPITALNLVRPELLDFSMFSAYCHHLPLQRLIKDLAVKASPYADIVPGGGKGATMLGPLLGAMGEMAERLLAMLHFTSLAERVVYGTFADLSRDGRNALPPSETPLFSDVQYANSGFDYGRYGNETFVGWVEGHDLLTGRSIWAPAQLVLMYYKPHPNEAPIGYATTAGLAFHPSRPEAILHGLYEVIERDALNLRWYSKLQPARVELNLEEEFAHLSRYQPRLIRNDMQVVVLDLSLDCPIPVLATITYDRSRRERSFLGGTGASSRRRQALAQALFELGQCQTAFRFEDPFGRLPITAETDVSELRDFFDAPLFYGHQRNLPRTSWFSSSTALTQWADIPNFDFLDTTEELAWATTWLGNLAWRPIIFDFDTASSSIGALTKVFVPQLSQACPPLNPMLGHPRFYEIAKRLGIDAGAKSPADLNPDPAPFA
jgi:ribosomal protein S12 methylthiotransferase accessory factor